MNMETAGSASAPTSRVMSALCKLLLTAAALCAMILMFSRTQQNDLEQVYHRERRDLIYPLLVFPSGTVFQINIAVQTPVSVPNKTLTISLGLQLNFVLPTNVTVFRQRNVTRSRREIGESLRSMYLPFQAFLQEHGFDGRTCTLRSICEAAHSPFSHEESGLLEEIAHAILTPSSEVPAADFDCIDSYSSTKCHHEEISYLAAELFGRSGGDCGFRYADCPESPLDLISSKINNAVYPFEEP